jgi:hypothetical protein
MKYWKKAMTKKVDEFFLLHNHRLILHMAGGTQDQLTPLILTAVGDN